MSSLRPKQKRKRHTGMNVDKNQTDFYESKLLPLANKSETDFIREYEAYDDKRQLYLQVLIGLGKAIEEGSVENFKKVQNIIKYIRKIESLETFVDLSNNDSNSFNHTNLIILACKHNQIQILEYLFEKDTRILHTLPVSIEILPIAPDSKDVTQHNAFYYAIRSGNKELLKTLISKWPGNYFPVHLHEIEAEYLDESDVIHLVELDEYLSRAYEELMLRQVPLSKEIKTVVESQLIDLRFFLNESGSNGNNKVTIQERIDLIIRIIKLLKQDYFDLKEIDAIFIFKAIFIAKNISILKRQLKSSYDRLPWEEIEFCLVSFVSSYIKREEMNIFYQTTLDKKKMLNYLGYFADKLENEKTTIGKIGKNANIQRDVAIQNIVKSCSDFKDLYNDYQKIRDIHSLQKIFDHIHLGLSAVPKQKFGRLVIIRVLQVIGECMKNTLESPKLSTTTSELLLNTFREKTRKIITGLRDSLSHDTSLAKRAELEKHKDDHFFIGIQTDLKKIGSVISHILYNSKIKAIRHILQDLIDDKNLNTVQVLRNIGQDRHFGTNEESDEHEGIEKLIDRLKSSVTELTDYEKELFHKIDENIKLKKLTQ